MKKTNKKGFTLIELLAVIIILGVIMLIAIPSVTQQITNSRKNSYSDTLQSYISAVVTEVNEGSIPMYDGTAVYAIPVGNNAEYSCVDLESGGASPFNKEFKYGYVFARYTGSSYNYWIEMVDGSNQGTLAVNGKKLEKSGSKYIHANITPNPMLVKAYGHTSYASTGTDLVEAKNGTGDTATELINDAAYKDYFVHIIETTQFSTGEGGNVATTSDKTGSTDGNDWANIIAADGDFKNGGQAATRIFFVKPSACRD